MPPTWEQYGIIGRITQGQRLRARPYERRLAQLIPKALDVIDQLDHVTEGRFYTAISFGVDSLVADHLVRRRFPHVRAMWVNQGPLAEWPDCLALRDAMVAQGLPLDELTPDITLYDWYRQFGIPLATSMGNAEDKRLNTALMYAPIERYQVATGARGYVWGLRSHGEGGHRKILLNTRGLLYHRKEDGQHVASPVGRWTKTEIWAYIDHHELLYPAMYDIDREQVRNGPPIGTTAVNLGRIVSLRRHFPDIWRAVVTEFPELERYT